MSIENTLNDALMIDTPDGINAYRLIALRGALKLETLGMQRSRRPSALAMVKAEFGLRGNAMTVLPLFECILEQIKAEFMEGQQERAAAASNPIKLGGNMVKIPIETEPLPLGGLSNMEARETVVTAAEARAEIDRHGEDWRDFIEQFGNVAEYDGSDVLDFLGY